MFLKPAYQSPNGSAVYFLTEDQVTQAVSEWATRNGLMIGPDQVSLAVDHEMGEWPGCTIRIEPTDTSGLAKEQKKDRT